MLGRSHHLKSKAGITRRGERVNFRAGWCDGASGPGVDFSATRRRRRPCMNW